MKTICIGSYCMSDVISAIPAIIHLSKFEPVEFYAGNFYKIVKCLLWNHNNIVVKGGITDPIDSEVFSWKNVVTTSLNELWFDHFFGHHNFDKSILSFPPYVSNKQKLDNFVALHVTYRLKVQSLPYNTWVQIINYIKSKGLKIVFVGRAFGNDYDTDSRFWPLVNKFSLDQAVDIISRCRLIITPIDGFCILTGFTSTNLLALATRVYPDPFLPIREKGISKYVKTKASCYGCSTKYGLDRKTMHSSICNLNYKCINMFDIDEIKKTIDGLL